MSSVSMIIPQYVTVYIITIISTYMLVRCSMWDLELFNVQLL